MKQEDIKHVLDTSEVEEEKELVFTHYINILTGERDSCPMYQPAKWDNVKHLTGNLYYAYDDRDYTGNLKGSVFVGEFK